MDHVINVSRNETRQMICVNVALYLADNCVHPRPVVKLESLPISFFNQLVECASFWDAEDRVAVASILLNRPLKSQGVGDVTFKSIDTDGDDLVSIAIDGDEDTSTEAIRAWERMCANNNVPRSLRVTLALDEIKKSWMELWEFAYSISRNGNIALNTMSKYMPSTTFKDLKDSELALITFAREAMHNAEDKQDA